MKLKTLIADMGILFECQSTNEEEVETLALASSNVGCTYGTFLDDKKYLDSLPKNARIVLTTKALERDVIAMGKCAIVVKKPRIVFFELHNALKDNPLYAREKFETLIGENCQISKNAVISKNNVIIGNNVIIEDFVVIKENTVIKNNCIIRTGTIIGGEGFEHKRNGTEILSVKHLGGVILEEAVELQQSNCVDKAIYPWDNTIVGASTKTDNCVHIAHADKLGERVFIAACACLAGRVETGDDVWIGPGATIINGISIGDKAKISIGSVVTQSVSAGAQVTGNFAVEHRKFMKFIKRLARNE